MSDAGKLPLPVVDGLELDAATRAVLKPNALIPDGEGRLRRLPRFFYEVPSWDVAMELYIVPHFSVAELIRVDVREHPLQRDFPRYVPLAITVLAVHLELLRQSINEPIHVAANGGYRSPSHAFTRHASSHCWGTAANLFRIGGQLMDSRSTIEKYNELIAEHLPGVWTRPWGRGKGFADDHVHLDLGYVTRIPRGAAGFEEPAESSPDDADAVTGDSDN